MADWRRVALAALLSDGVIDDAEVKVIKKELYTFGKIDPKELDFLIDLRCEAEKKARGKGLNRAFESMFFKAVQDSVLADGNITAKETAFLRRATMADGKVDAAEIALLRRLKKNAKTTSPAFNKLYADCVGK